jgi:predicted NAD-dependent protein-ADP-ribosyltransferase YbiA (DUF1768 family)
MDRKYIPGEDYIYYWSNAKAPYHQLSNFHLVKDYFFEKIQYPSVEHAYVSQFYDDKQQFSVTGKYRNFQYCDASEDYWMKKMNIGIVAKMANNKLRGEKISSPVSHKKWIEIQMEKYKMSPFKELLLSTKDTYLCEFGRKNMIKAEHWTGMIHDNQLYGENFSGRVLMEVRKLINLL